MFLLYLCMYLAVSGNLSAKCVISFSRKHFYALELELRVRVIVSGNTFKYVFSQPFGQVYIRDLSSSHLLMMLGVDNLQNTLF